MRNRRFTTVGLGEELGIKKQSTRKLLQELVETEQQAMMLVALIKKHNYLSVEKLADLLEEQKLGPVRYSNLVAFLAGYLASEGFGSAFDVALFGEMSIDMGKGITVGASLAALLYYIDKTGRTAFPDRRQTGSTDLTDVVDQSEEEGLPAEIPGLGQGAEEIEP